MSPFKIWFHAIRPNTLTVSLSPVLIGSSVAMTQGFFHPLTFLFTLLTSLGIQIVTNLSNDYFDFLKGADTPARIGPLRVTQAGLVSLKEMKIAVFLTSAVTVLAGSYLIYQGGIVFALLVAVAIALAIGYTAGPYPLAYLGLGQLFTFVFFGPVATYCTYYLQTHQFAHPAWIAGLIPGLLSAAILTANNLRDADEDRSTNKRTLVVRWGTAISKGLYCGMILTAALTPLFLIHYRHFVFLSLFVILPTILLCLQTIKNQERPRYNVILVNTAQLLLIYTLIFCCSYML